ALQSRKCESQQAQLCSRMSEVNWPRAPRRIGPRKHQLPCQLEGVLIDAFEHESASICQNSGVEADRDRRRDLNSGLLCQLIDQFPGGNRLRLDPIHVREVLAAKVMIDVDQEAILEPFEPRALNAVAFEQDRGIVIAIHPFRMTCSFGKWKLLINPRNSTVQKYFGLLP